MSRFITFFDETFFPIVVCFGCFGRSQQLFSRKNKQNKKRVETRSTQDAIDASLLFAARKKSREIKMSLATSYL